jgi:hypothetical protein
MYNDARFGAPEINRRGNKKWLTTPIRDRFAARSGDPKLKNGTGSREVVGRA